MVTTSFSVLETVTTESNNRTRKILERLYREHVKIFEAVSCSFLILVMALQVRWQLARIVKMIGFLVIETDEDRSWCEDRSEQLLGLSERIDEAKKNLHA